jgi:hypothetical protein
METAYDKIMKVKGMEEMKLLASRMKLAAENRDRLGLDAVPLPDFLFAEAPGSGITTHLHLFAELLEELNLMSFQGEKKVVEQVLDDRFQPILDTVRDAAGFHNEFRGVVGVEIRDHSSSGAASEELQRLIDFARDKQEEILFVFICRLENDAAPRWLVKKLSLALPLEVIHFPSLTVEELVYYTEGFLRRQGFELSEEAARYLADVMPKLQAVDGFDGLRSIDTMVSLLIYQACATRKMEIRVITQEMIETLLEGGYMNQLSVLSPKVTRKIGFGGAD